MEIEEKTTERRVIEVEGVEFYAEDIVEPLGWLRHSSVKDTLVDSSVLRRMKKAGLVRKKKSGGFMSMNDDEGTIKWEQVNGKCEYLFEELTEPYYRLRPKHKSSSSNEFGMWDEKEDENAREKAEEKVAELNERNPDVDFYLDEEQLNSIRVKKS